MPEGNPPSPRYRQPLSDTSNGNGTPALENVSSPETGSNKAYNVELYRPGTGRTRSRLFSSVSTPAGSSPVLLIPRIVPITSAAYNAAVTPLPTTSPRYNPTSPFGSWKKSAKSPPTSTNG